MKKMLRSLVLLALLAVPLGSWAQQSLPYSYGFEDETELDNWGTVNMSPENADYFGISEDAAKTGDYGFIFGSYENASDYSQYLISPELTSERGVEIHFWYMKGYSWVSETFKVGYSTTTNDVESFTWGEQITATDDWEEYVETFPATVKYIAIYYTSNFQYYLYVDDFTFQEPPTCMPVSGLTASDMQENSITIAWADLLNDDGISYTVRYTKEGSNDTTDVTDLNELTYTAEGLDASSLYHFIVIATCSSDDASAPISASFHTACGEQTLPYTENWESYGVPNEGTWNDCWLRPIMHGTDPSINAQHNHTANGSYGLFLLADGDSNLVVSPQINLPGNSIYVNFWAWLNSVTDYDEATWDQITLESWLQAGVMTDPNDISTFIALDTITTRDGDFHEYEFTTSALDAEATYYVAFLFYGPQTSYYAYESPKAAIDDIVIREDNGCNRPQGLAISNITAEGATLSWEAEEGQTAWKVKVGANGEVRDAYENTFSFEGLQPRTAYTVYVATACDGDAMSDFSSIGFTTDCANGSCDLTVEMADQYNDGWTGNAVEAYQNGVLAGSATLETGNPATATINVCSGMATELRFKKGSYPSEISFTVKDGSDAVVYTAAQGTFSNSTADGTVLATLENACPSCLTPADLQVAAVDSTSATLTWTAIESMPEYIISFNGGEYTTAEEPGSYSATELSPNTLYTFSVKAVCEADVDTSNARTITFRTTCGAMVLPYEEGFEDQEAGAAPLCWNTVVEGYDDSPAIGVNDTWDENAHSGNNYLTLAGNSTHRVAMTATAAVPLAGDQIYVGFWANINNGDTLYAGVMSNVTDESTFQPVLTIVGEGAGYQLYEFNTNGLESEATYHVAFRLSTVNSYWGSETYIDDLVVREDNGCMTPRNFVAGANENSLDLAWVNPGTDGAFIVSYREVDGEWSAYVDATDATSHTISGLEPSTAYEVRLGNVCGGDTLWAALSTRTTCGAYSTPYEEIFYSDDQTTPDCWDYTDPSLFHFNNWQVVGGVGGSYPGDGTMMAGNNSAYEYAILPKFNSPFGKLQISFDAKLGNISEGDSMIIAVYNPTHDPEHPFTIAAKLADPNQSREGAVRFEYNFINYTGPEGRIAISHTHNYTGSGGYGWEIDNLNVIALSSCLPPMAPEAHNSMYPNDASEVYITWNRQGSASQWQVYMDTISSTIDIEDVAEENLILVDDTVYHPAAGMLQNGGRYRFFVRTYCGEDNYSIWVPIQNGFGTSVVWMNNDVVADTIDGCNFVVYDNGGPVAGYLYNSNSNLVIRSGEEGRNPQITSIHLNTGDHQFSFKVYDGIGTNGEELFSFEEINANVTFNDVVATSTTGALTIQQTGGAYRAAGFEFTVVCVSDDDCPRPSNLHVESVNNTSATLAWDGEAPNYRVNYRQSGAQTWENRVVNSTSVTLSGLTTGATYECTVVALCSDDNTSIASSALSFVASENQGPDPVGIEEVEHNAITLFPNPASSSVTLRGVEEGATIMVLDLNGREVLRSQATTIDLSGVARGAYFVRIVSEQQSAIRKLIVK